MRLRDTEGRPVGSEAPPVVRVGREDEAVVRREEMGWRWRWQAGEPLTDHALDVHAEWTPPWGEGVADDLRICWQDGWLRAEALDAASGMRVPTSVSASVNGMSQPVIYEPTGAVRLNVAEGGEEGAVAVLLRIDSRTWHEIVVLGETTPRPCTEPLVSQHERVPVYGGLTSVNVKVEPSVSALAPSPLRGSRRPYGIKTVEWCGRSPGHVGRERGRCSQDGAWLLPRCGPLVHRRRPERRCCRLGWSRGEGRRWPFVSEAFRLRPALGWGERGTSGRDRHRMDVDIRTRWLDDRSWCEQVGACDYSAPCVWTAKTLRLVCLHLPAALM